MAEVQGEKKMKCYICGTTENVNHKNECEQEGSTAVVRYCSCCGGLVDEVWNKEFKDKRKVGAWIHNEKDFWFLFNEAKRLYLESTKGTTENHPLWELHGSRDFHQQQKIDPYKEHREKIEKSHEFDRWKLNQEKCALCGKDGTHENIVRCDFHVKTDYIYADRMHRECFQTTQRVARILNVSSEVALEKLKELISPPKKTATKKQCEVKCFGDFSQNPWNR